MKTLKDFTPEVQAKIPEYIKKYTAGVFDGGRHATFKREDAEALIDWNYETSGFKKPVVLIAGNPYESQLFFNYIKANEKIFTPILYAIYCLRNGIESPKSDNQNNQLGNQLGNQLDSQLRSQLGNQLGNQLDSQLHSQLDSQLRSQLDSQLRSQLDSQLRSQLDSQLRNQLGSQLGKYNYDYLFTANVYSNAYAAYYKFIADELNVGAEINVMLNSWGDLYEKSGVYSAIFSELVCVVSKYPKKVHRDANNNLHSIEGPCVDWEASCEETKFNSYFINGRPIPEREFNSIQSKSYSFQDFAKESNEEIKSACIALMQELYGNDYLFDFFREFLKQVDNYVDKKEDKYLKGTTGGMNVGVYTLFKGNVNSVAVAFVRVYCPSSDRMFFLGVDPVHNNAKDAIASLYRVPKKLRDNIKYIQRQGERFSTVFDDKGTELLQSGKLSKEDISDTTTITGQSYFSNLTYEY